MTMILAVAALLLMGVLLAHGVQVIRYARSPQCIIDARLHEYVRRD